LLGCSKAPFFVHFTFIFVNLHLRKDETKINAKIIRKCQVACAGGDRCPSALEFIFLVKTVGEYYKRIDTLDIPSAVGETTDMIIIAHDHYARAN
jgi:hypothetical protein